MGNEYFVQFYYDVDSAHSAIFAFVSYVYYTMHDFWVGMLDPKELRDAEQLHSAGHYRFYSTNKNVILTWVPFWLQLFQQELL